MGKDKAASVLQPHSGYLKRAVENIKKRRPEYQSQRITSGFQDLDRIITTFNRGDLIWVAGRPSMGKTAFCTHIALHVALNSVSRLLISPCKIPALNYRSACSAKLAVFHLTS